MNTPPTREQIRAVERGEVSLESLNQSPKSRQHADELKKIVEQAKRAADDSINPNSPSSVLGDLLQLGGQSEVPALTIGGIAVLEAIKSPFLDEGEVTITSLDTARALWAFAGGCAGCAPLLSALAMERAAQELDPDYAAPLHIKAGMLRGEWDAQAIRAVESTGKSKAEIDAELLVRIREIVNEMGLLT
jgi:hypothetical protein